MPDLTDPTYSSPEGKLRQLVLSFKALKQWFVPTTKIDSTYDMLCLAALQANDAQQSNAMF